MALNNALFFDSPEQAMMALEREGKKLMKIAKIEWQKYLKSYKPVQYIRTGNSERAIKLGKPKMIGANQYGIELTWVNNLVYHNSVVPNSNKKGHSVMLISSGWHSKKLEKIYGRQVYRHTYYEGNSYINNVMKKYESQKDRRIDLELQWSGAFTK